MITFFLRQFVPCRVDVERIYHIAQIESMVELIGEIAEVAGRVLLVLQRLGGTRRHSLGVAQHGVDPLDLWLVLT